MKTLLEMNLRMHVRDTETSLSAAFVFDSCNTKMSAYA